MITLEPNRDLASPAWLQTHFRTKCHHRIHEISTLPIFPGDRVIDIGSGPGIFARHIAMMVGESGRVLCLDRDEHNISLAEKNLQTVGVYNHDLLCGDFYDAIGIASNYNVIVMMNSLCYLDDYLGFLAEISKKMRPGARIIIKDFDMQAFIFSGIPAVRWGNLIESAMRYDRTKENPLPYKNFFGRYIHSLHRMLRIDSFKNDVWSQNINYPFTDSSKKYIWENIRSLLDQAKDLDCVERDFFIKVFNENDGIFYKNDDSMVVETEFITTLNL